MELKKIGIIAAMEEEIKTLKEAIENVSETSIANSTFIEGTYKGSEIVLIQSGIGKVNATIATVLLIQQFQCETIINTGSGGGVHENLQVGDVVLSTEVAHFDADATAFGYEWGQIPQMPRKYEASIELGRQMESAALSSNLPVKRGEIVSGDSFVSSKETISHILNHFPEAFIVEMEGAAVAQTCWLFGVPFLIVRAVSDTADQEAAQSFDEFIEEAGRKSAQMVLNFLESNR